MLTASTTMQQSILMVAGEASADLHGAKVLEALRHQVPHLDAFGIGGRAMQTQGFEALVDAQVMSLAGLTEVLWALPRMFWVMHQLTQWARRRRPTVALLIDLPDFNLRLARRLKRLGIPVVYYISPQIWAWRAHRVKQIAKLVDKMLVILPFEEDFYRAHGVCVQFVGHPLTEQLPRHPDRALARDRLCLPPEPTPIVALLPGSRPQEVRRHLPVMLAGLKLAQRHYAQLQAVLPVASTVAPALVADLVAASGVAVHVIAEQATECLIAADAAVVCSGTATLQAALLLRPMVVVYRVSWLSYQILRRLIRVAHIALVNLIAGEALVSELVQKQLTAEHVAEHVVALLEPNAARHRLTARLATLRERLGRHDTAHTVAHAVLDFIGPYQVSAPPIYRLRRKG